MIRNEHMLIDSLKKGNINAFEQLFHGYYNKVHYFARSLLNNREDAENLTQETFIALWENRQKLDDNTVIGRYLYKIARNLVMNHIRKKVSQQSYFEYVYNHSSNQDNSTQNEIDRAELEEMIKKSIDQIPPRRKEIFLLSFEKGLTYKEIAERLSISENTVDTQIRNALNFLREKISKMFPLFI
ncbi:MAG: RNA polymerase sigma-70 factor, partial [Bacteroidales bacterium]|nr:RNA polymerase sigma-70 factor [Bacteroidales bacterium]